MFFNYALIEKFMERENLSINEFCKRCKISKITIQRLLNGNTKSI